MTRASQLRLSANWLSCPQCDATIAIRGSAQTLTCSSCDTDLHYDGAGKCRTVFRRSDSASTAPRLSEEPAPSR